MRTTQQNPLIWLLLLLSISACLFSSTIVADANISIDAARNLAITASADNYNQQSTSRSKTSGVLGSVWQPAVGVVKQNQTSQQNGLTLNSSQIASLGSNGSGNISLSAGETITQSASNILAKASAAGQGNITLAAQNIDITSAAQLADSQQHSQYSKVAFGGSISTPLLSAVQSLGATAGALQNTNDSRLQTLAAINTALTVKSAADSASALANGDLSGLKVSLSLGSSKTQSTSHESSSTAIGSAGGNLAIIASNGNNPNDPSKGNLNITGSSLSAGNNTLLHADNSLTLQAAQNTSTLESSNKSSGSSIGIGFAIGGSQNGFTLDASANRASGHANGTDTTQLNTQVTAGNNLNLSSGADTNLKGATVSAHSINANIGGDLNLVSQQDSSQYTSKQTSSGLGVSLCLPPYCYGNSSATGSYGKSKINGDYQSVNSQSGIQAGDGGFTINVSGNTDLKGAVIASTQKAIDDGKNSLTTGSLTQSDLQNKDTYHASGFALSATVATKITDQSGASKNADQRAASDKINPAQPGASAGIGSQNGSQNSSTLSGISAGNITITNDAKQLELTGKDSKTTIAGLVTGITTDTNTSGALTKAWNSQQLQKQIDAQISITQTFSQLAPKAVADYANQQAANLKAQAEQAAQENDPSKAAELQAEAKKWDEGGAYRIALHSVTGALSGGLTGAAGAATAASAAPLLQNLQTATEQALTEQGLGSSAVKAIAQGIAEVTAIGLGAAVGGINGAATSLVVDTNNRQLDPKERTLAKQLADKSGGKYTEKEIQDALRYSGVRDSNGNLVIAEGTQELLINRSGTLTNINTGISIQDTYKADPNLQLRPADAITLIEDKPGRPSNDLIAYIQNNTGGNTSPFVFTPAKTVYSSSGLPPAPDGTTRTTVIVDGAVYFPLVANCPASNCSNGSPIANAIPDAGTAAYNEALARKTEKDLNIAGSVLGVVGAVTRGVGVIAETAEAGAVNGANSAETVKVFRVEGGGNQRLIIDEAGNVDIPTLLTNKGRGPERNLYLNFGDEARAQQFLEQRLQQFPDNTIKSFEVPKSFLDELRATAVTEAERSLYPTRPVIADPTKAPNQFGLTAEQLQKLRQVIIKGSGG